VANDAFLLRDGIQGDADQLTDVFLRARAVAMPWLVGPHGPAATRWWMEHVVLAEQRVRVAYDGSRVVGFAALHGNWVEHLYIDPEDQGRGVGRRLLEETQRASPSGISLHVFARNERARRFYEAAGFTLADESDGSGNEEHEPDCTYAWSNQDQRPPGGG
jgi:putative acetyltransferase